MESPTQSDESLKAVTHWNDELAHRVTRWKRLRLTIAVLLAAVGVVSAFAGSAFLWTTPCLIAASVAYLLYLDSRDQLREVKSRKWKASTPRTTHLEKPKNEDAVKPAS